MPSTLCRTAYVAGLFFTNSHYGLAGDQRTTNLTVRIQQSPSRGPKIILLDSWSRKKVATDMANSIKWIPSLLFPSLYEALPTFSSAHKWQHLPLHTVHCMSSIFFRYLLYSERRQKECKGGWEMVWQPCCLPVPFQHKPSALSMLNASFLAKH